MPATAERPQTPPPNTIQRESVTFRISSRIDRSLFSPFSSFALQCDRHDPVEHHFVSERTFIARNFKRLFCRLFRFPNHHLPHWPKPTRLVCLFVCVFVRLLKMAAIAHSNEHVNLNSDDDEVRLPCIDQKAKYIFIFFACSFFFFLLFYFVANAYIHICQGTSSNQLSRSTINRFFIVNSYLAFQTSYTNAEIYFVRPNNTDHYVSCAYLAIN